MAQRLTPLRFYAKERDVSREWSAKTAEDLDREIDRIYRAIKALSEEVLELQALSGPGGVGPVGPPGPAGAALGLFGGEDGGGDDSPMVVPGPRGRDGDPGRIGPPGEDGADGEDAYYLLGSLAADDGILYYAPLTDGDATQPELIFAGGDVIMVPVFA